MTRFPPKKILVPFDLSALSAAAWRHAAALARRFGAELEVVHVRDWALGAELAPLPPPALSSEDRRELLARIRETVGIRPKITLAVGDPARVLLRLARSRRVDLIVMGTHGRTGLERVFLGSVTEAVVRGSPAPVLAVRGRSAAIRSVLAPVNFSATSDCGFAYASEMAAALDARLTALHVHVDPLWNGDPGRKLSRLVERLPAARRRSCRPVVETGQSEATRGILKAAASHDVIVLVAHETPPLKDVLLGTTAERVLRGCAASVLVVPVRRGEPEVRKDHPTPCCAPV